MCMGVCILILARETPFKHDRRTTANHSSSRGRLQAPDNASRLRTHLQRYRVLASLQGFTEYLLDVEDRSCRSSRFLRDL